MTLSLQRAFGITARSIARRESLYTGTLTVFWSSHLPGIKKKKSQRARFVWNSIFCPFWCSYNFAPLYPSWRKRNSAHNHDSKLSSLKMSSMGEPSSPSTGWMFLKRCTTVQENYEARASLKHSLFAEAILLDDWLEILSALWGFETHPVSSWDHGTLEGRQGETQPCSSLWVPNRWLITVDYNLWICFA